MANIIGTVEGIEGKFYAKDSQGNMRELKNADQVYEGETIVPGANNILNEKITIALADGTASLQINSTKEQLLDKTLLNEGLNNEELAFNPEDIQNVLVLNNTNPQTEEAKFAQLDGAQTDINSDLRQKQFGGDDSDYKQETKDTQESRFAALDGSITDVNSDLRQASWPGIMDYEQIQNADIVNSANVGSTFAIRDGDSTDIVSDLRQAEWFTPTEEPTYKGEVENINNNFIDLPPIPQTIIKVVATDDSGQPLVDSFGNYTGLNETAEGGHTYYVALAFKPGTTVFNDTTKLATQNGTVDLTFTNGTATTNDYIPPAGLTNITLGTKITANALDDYIADNGEKFTVTISNYTPVASSTYGATTINNLGVTTTITDNSKPNTPNDQTDDTVETQGTTKDIVMIKLFAADEIGVVIKDGSGNYQLANSADEVTGSKAKYIAYAFNDGETTFSDATKLTTQVGQVNVEFTDGTAVGINATTLTNTNGTEDYNKTPQTIQIGQSFSTEVFKDLVADGGQTYTVKLLDNTYASYNGSSYESVNTDNTAVTTTIKEVLFAKIEAVDNEANESETLTYTITIVDELGNPVTVTGDAVVKLGYIGISAKPADDSDDYTPITTVTVLNGHSTATLTINTKDDYFAEGDEKLQITITSVVYGDVNSSIKPHTIANGANSDKIIVDGTIKDNPANDTTKNPQETPNETGGYGPEDTVYVKITNAPSTIEGGNLPHTITLVNSAGEAVTVPTGQTVTVTLAYTVHTGDFTESDLSTIVKSVIITGGTNHTDFTNITKDDFTAEVTEKYTVTITNVAQSGAFENVAISATNSTTGTITDGVTLGTPTNATVDEDNFDMANNVTTINDTKLLNITAPNGDNAYNLLFDGNPTFTSDNGSYTVLKSDGKTIEYVVSGNTTTAYAGTGRTVSDKVFVITLDKHNAGGGDDDYTYTQYKNIDHPTVNVDDNVVLTFGYKITDQGQTSSVQTFTVTVSDSLPSGTGQSITLDEDGSKIIYISDESFKDGKITLNNGVGADQEVLKDGTINIYDTAKDDVVGTLKNNGDGTVIFTPNADYSGTTAGFTYGVSDGDGDTATATIGITVNPIADKPTLADKTVTTWEDANTTDAAYTDGNQREGTNVKSLGLAIPVKKDQIDQNDYDVTDDSGTSAGDNPERLGAIEFSFATSGDFGTATIKYDTNGDGTLDGTLQTIDKNSTFTVDITGVANYHVVGTSGTYHLTQAQYESIAIMHAEDNATNIKTKIEVASHEVQENGSVYTTDIVSAKASQIITLDVKAVTDNITLAWNDTTNTLGTNDGSTFTFTNVNEGVALIDLKSLLTKTSGFEIDTHGDLDGSEKRSYTISGIPEGTVVTLGSNSATANALGEATVNFSDADNKLEDPAFTMTLNKEYSGTLSGTITLNVTDTDGDSSGAIATKTAAVNFTMTINPVADQVTLKVAQAQGDEDAGRTGSNNENVNASDIDAPQNGIVLNINVISDDNKDIGPTTIDPKEKYTVSIDKIPDGGSLHVWDNTTSTWKTINETNAGTNDGLFIVNNADSTWKVTITDYQNDHLTKFIPPYNSDADYTGANAFEVKAYSVDGTSNSLASIQTLTIDVTVDGVADIPVNDALATHTTNDDTSTARTFNLVTTEDTIGGTSIKGIFATPTTLDSNDNDSSETLTFKVSGLATGFGITGATFIGGSGTSRMWLVNKADLIADSVKLTTPEHYAGEVDFKVQFVTTEASGDSKTHAAKDVSVMITPVAETTVTVKSSDTQDEDTVKALDFGFSTPDSGNATSGQESLQSFSIDVTGLQAAGITLVSNGVDLTTGKTGHQSVTVTNGVLTAVTATLPQDSDVDYGFNISYIYQDVAKDTAGNIYTDTKTVTNQAYNVTVNAITDDISLAMATITSANNTDNAGHVTVTGNGTFTKTLTVTGLDTDGRGSADTDGSEIFTRVTVSGVPEGITVGGAYGQYAGDTGGGNYSGFWYVDVPNDAIDSSATFALEFNVDGSFAAGLPDYPITVTAYSEDRGNGVEQSDSQVFTLTIANTVTGPGPGTPAVIVEFYQDIDQDNKTTPLTHSSNSDHGYEVSTVTNTIITDADAYQNSVLREDKEFKLSDVVHVETNTTGASSLAFSITLKDVPAGVTVKGMTLNANGFYTLSGSGDQQAIVDKLQTILITPELNKNTDAGSIAASDLAFNIELTTYAAGGAKNTALINFTGSVLPVTDEMNLTVGNDGTTLEDTAQTFSITLGEGNDGTKTSIVDGTVYVKLTENYSDFNSGDGTAGTLSLGGSVITASAVSGVTGIADGNYYVITGATNNEVLNFSYAPAANRDGTITVDTYVKNIESETWTTYTPAELTTHKSFSFNVTAVTDGFTLSSATANGTEDVMVPLGITLTSVDSSEKLSSVSISGVPNGFLLFYGVDVGSAVIAQNLGTTGTQASIEMMHGKPILVDVNTWNIPLTAGALPAYIGLKAPANWSGTVPTITVNSVDTLGNSSSAVLDVTIAPLVDSLTLNTTNTFGNAGADISLNLNANVTDLDGSETVKLELTGLGAGASFKANGVEIDALNISYSGDTYTISKIAAADINALSFVQSAMNGTVKVDAYMVESDTTTSVKVAGTDFNVNISAVTPTGGDDTLLYSGSAINGGAGIDTILIKSGVALDFTKLDNIEKIDLTANGNHAITNLTLSDVISMTDNNKNLTIIADARDSVEFKNEDGKVWSNGVSDGNGFNDYTNTGDPTVTLKISYEATVTIAL